MNTSARRLVNFQGTEYMPINLKGALQRYGLSQRDWCAAVLQANGQPLSHSAATMILNWNTWPKKTPAHSIQAQTEAWLVSIGTQEEDLKDLWAVDTEDRYRLQHPAGAHIGQGLGLTHTRRNDIDTDESPETREMLSTEARKHFGLFRDPFQDDIQSAEDVYLSADQRYIREAIFSTAKHGGFVAVVGESGAGKTVLRKDMLERIAREQQPIIPIQPRVIDKARLNAGLIFEAIIDDLRPGEKMRRTQEGKARQAERLLRDSSRAGNSHVLIIEEAHDLSIQTLKVLKRFWELEDGFKRLMSIILIGQPELALMLDERARPEAREVIRRCEVAILAPLDRHLEEYLQMKFRRIGADLPNLFSADALEAMREVKGPQMRPGGVVAKPSQLYPLVVNNLVTRALNAAAERGVPQITGDVIRGL